MQQRDAAQAPQASAFRPDDNSPFIRHWRKRTSLFLRTCTYSANYKLDTVYHSNQKLQSKKLPPKAAF